MKQFEYVSSLCFVKNILYSNSFEAVELRSHVRTCSPVLHVLASSLSSQFSVNLPAVRSNKAMKKSNNNNNIHNKYSDSSFIPHSIC